MDLTALSDLDLLLLAGLSFAAIVNPRALAALICSVSVFLLIARWAAG